MIQRLGLLLTLSLFIPQNARAFSFSPMSISFEPSGPAATRSFFVENTTTDKVALQISFSERTLEKDGSEKNPGVADLEKKFLIFPKQMVLAPKEKRSIRVSWVGEAQFPIEKAFRMRVEQLPVDLEKRKKPQASQIRMLLKYVAALYITPKDAKAKVEVEWSESKNQEWALIVKNSGTEHVVLKQPRLLFVAEQDASQIKYEVPKENIKLLEGLNLLAGSEVRLVIKPGLMSRDQLKPKLEYTSVQ